MHKKYQAFPKCLKEDDVLNSLKKWIGGNVKGNTSDAGIFFRIDTYQFQEAKLLLKTGIVALSEIIYTSSFHQSKLVIFIVHPGRFTK